MKSLILFVVAVVGLLSIVAPAEARIFGRRVVVRRPVVVQRQRVIVAPHSFHAPAVVAPQIIVPHGQLIAPPAAIIIQ